MNEQPSNQNSEWGKEATSQWASEGVIEGMSK